MKTFTDVTTLAELRAIHVLLNYCYENSFLKCSYVSEPTLQKLQRISKDLGNFYIISKYSTESWL